MLSDVRPCSPLTNARDRVACDVVFSGEVRPSCPGLPSRSDVRDLSLCKLRHSVPRTNSHSTFSFGIKRVVLTGSNFQVVWPNARLPIAPMQDDQAIRNWPVSDLVRVAMGSPRDAMPNIEASVPMIHVPNPEPTRIGLLHLSPESHGRADRLVCVPADRGTVEGPTPFNSGRVDDNHSSAVSARSSRRLGLGHREPPFLGVLGDVGGVAAAFAPDYTLSVAA